MELGLFFIEIQRFTKSEISEGRSNRSLSAKSGRHSKLTRMETKTGRIKCIQISEPTSFQPMEKIWIERWAQLSLSSYVSVFPNKGETKGSSWPGMTLPPVIFWRRWSLWLELNQAWWSLANQPWGTPSKFSCEVEGKERESEIWEWKPLWGYEFR